jgi:hypothetical protein
VKMNRLSLRLSLLVSLLLSLLASSPAIYLCMVHSHASRAADNSAPRILDTQAASIAKLALDGIHRQYPNKPSNVLVGPADVLSPKELHPAFYGCFDWHSSVHGHWTLVRLLKTNPMHALAQTSRERLDQSLTKENIDAETAYFRVKENRSFERMYGWAWLLRLVAELHTWDDPQARQWLETLKPLENEIVALTLGYLPRLSNPIRTGVHPDTAFALGQTLDYARTVGNLELAQAVEKRSREYYMNDRNYASQYEPSGEDFFSPSLNEADLMRRILPAKDFETWLNLFLNPSDPEAHTKLLTPVVVSDLTDGKLVHLAGLNLSRAWTLDAISQTLPENGTWKDRFASSAQAHRDAGLAYVFSGHYEGEHWLGTFAVYALTGVGR